MGRIAALVAGITAAIAAGWAVLTRRRSGGGRATKQRGKGRGKGKRAGGGGKGKRGGAAGQRGSKQHVAGAATAASAARDRAVETEPGAAGSEGGVSGTGAVAAEAEGGVAGTAADARQELSTAGAVEATPGTGEEAERYGDEAGDGAAPTGDADDASGGELQAVKGIGAVSQERLAELGITTLAQVAAWTDDDVERVAEQIKIGAERIKREDWVGQARAAIEDVPPGP